MTIATEFWKQKQPEAFTIEEWEAICCRCGNCCRLKLEDEESGDIYYTDVICRYFDLSNNLCQQYHQRCRLVPECLKLTEQNWNKINWMPTNCAYRILYQTGDLPSWHPLKTKKPLADKYSVKNKVISEQDVPEEELEDHIVNEDFSHDE